MIFFIFVGEFDSTAGRHHQENKPRNLEPQLMRHLPQGAARGGDGASCCPHHPVALGLLGRDARPHPYLADSRNLAHGLDFISLWGYNDANLRCRPKLFDHRGHLSGQWYVLSQSGRRSGDHVDQQLKQLMKELGEAINESLSDSEQIADVVSRIKEGGYDIFLVLEATIGVSKQGEKSSDKTSLVTTLSTNPEFKINDQDMKFLKSLRIKIEEEKEK